MGGGFQGTPYPTLPSSTVPHTPWGRDIPDPQEGIWGILSCDTFAEPQDYGSSDQVLGLKAVGLGTGCCGIKETGTFSEMAGSTFGTLLPDPNQLPT